MPTRVRLNDGAREWTLEVDEPHVRVVGENVEVAVTRQGDGAFEAAAGGRTVRGVAMRQGRHIWVTIGGRVFVFDTTTRAGHTASSERDALSVPMPATVVRVAVTPGQAVQRGDLLVALEAMKMELAIRAPEDGVVSAVHCKDGELVQPGHVLVEL
jgi:3-methylcrotonyl-CoA carboxylase alpha subunit